jgi:hypothetical protein
VNLAHHSKLSRFFMASLRLLKEIFQIFGSIKSSQIEIKAALGGAMLSPIFRAFRVEIACTHSFPKPTIILNVLGSVRCSSSEGGRRTYPRVPAPAPAPAPAPERGAWPSSRDGGSRSVRPSHAARQSREEGGSERDRGRVAGRDGGRDRGSRGVSGYKDGRRSGHNERNIDGGGYRREGGRGHRNREYGRDRDRDSGSDQAMGPGPDRSKWGEFDGDHLYGLSPVKAALLAAKRDLVELLVRAVCVCVACVCVCVACVCVCVRIRKCTHYTAHNF